MEIAPIVLDHRPSYLEHAPAEYSLLSLPVGAGTVMGHLVGDLPEGSERAIRILPMFPQPAGYRERVLDIAPSGASVIEPDGLLSIVHDCEPSDLLLIIDPRYWPTGGLDVSAVMRSGSDQAWAVHCVALGSPRESAKEYVHCDDDGYVRRISRYYDQVTNLKIDAIAYSVIPVASFEHVRFESLADLRAALAAWGVLSRDVPATSAVVDLSEESGLLTINEQSVVAALSSETLPGFDRHACGMFSARGCRVDSSARIVGPVILQENVVIEAGATVIGPSVLGEGCRVREGGLIAQSVLTRGSTVLSNRVVRQSVRAGQCEGDGSVEAEKKHTGGDVTKSLQHEGIRLGADASAMRDVRSDPARVVTLKLIFDVVLAFISLIVVSPLIAVVAILIKLDSKGPVFFGHLREGKDGKVFKCLKFRTMCQDAHLKQRDLYSTNNLDGPQFKIDNDPRVTRVGAWLRATNIDEIPQFINVLLGQMSFVGPRPSPFRENQICIPWRRARLSVRPGITGLWQICRDQRSEGDFHQWIAYDIMYVRHMSPWLDVKIFLATILTLGGVWSVRPTWLVRNDRVIMQPGGVVAASR